MAITDLDGLVAGLKPPVSYHKAVSGTLVAGRPFSPWAIAGFPGASTYPNTANGAVVTSTGAPAVGSVPFYDPAGGSNTYLARFVGAAAQPGTLVLADKLWHCGGTSGFTLTSTSAQSITSPTWPARDLDGTTNGKGVQLGVHIATATGAGTPTLTLTYTNSGGTGSRTGTNIIGTSATSAAGTFYPIGMAAGDEGVRSVQSIQQSATWTSGAYSIVAYRELARLDIPFANGSNSIDFTRTGFPQLFDGTAPFLIFYPSTTTTTPLFGSVTYAQG